MKARRLAIRETIAVDAERLAELVLDMGEQAAEAYLCDAMEDIAVRLAKVDRLRRGDDFDGVAAVAAGLVPVADAVGMSGLARVAGDVAACAGSRDMPALDATMGRLGRVGQHSLSAIWDPCGMPA